MRYSQSNEQNAIFSYFGNRIGRFLDLGAHDGESLSNTRALALAGWSGVLVEPHPEYFIKLWQLYRGNPQFILVNAAIGRENERLGYWFYNYEKPGYASTLVEEKMQAFAAANRYDGNYWIACIQSSDLIKFGPYNLISIDIEGLELEALIGLGKNTLSSISMVIVEKGQQQPAIEQYLHGNGFRMLTDTPENLIMIK